MLRNNVIERSGSNERITHPVSHSAGIFFSNTRLLMNVIAALTFNSRQDFSVVLRNDELTQSEVT
ncbi:MAG: hypothetical protein AAFN93_04795 [Bacteroidota bacterium]